MYRYFRLGRNSDFEFDDNSDTIHLNYHKNLNTCTIIQIFWNFIQILLLKLSDTLNFVAIEFCNSFNSSILSFYENSGIEIP